MLVLIARALAAWKEAKVPFLIFNSSNTPVYRMYSIIDSSSFVNDELARAWLKLAASMMGLLEDNTLFT